MYRTRTEINYLFFQRRDAGLPRSARSFGDRQTVQTAAAPLKKQTGMGDLDKEHRIKRKKM